jgi:Calcineurin-like phosphoesterase
MSVILSFQWASDLHLDCHSPSDQHKWPKIPRLAPVLVLAGDVGRVNQSHYVTYLKQLCASFERVILVPGNHEYYQASKPTHTFEETERALQSLNIDNLIVLQKSSAVVNGIRFVGCTLWSDIDLDNPFIQAEMSDYHKIYNGRDEADITKRKWPRMKPAIIKGIHKQHCQYLMEAISASEEPVIVVTHHCPTLRHLIERKASTPMSSCYATPLDITHPDLFGPPVVSWICGHSHRTMEEYATNADGHRVLMLMNAHGYPSETIAGYSGTKVAHVVRQTDDGIEVVTQL